MFFFQHLVLYFLFFNIIYSRDKYIYTFFSTDNLENK